MLAGWTVAIIVNVSVVAGFLLLIVRTVEVDVACFNCDVPQVDTMVEALCVLLQEVPVMSRDQAAKSLVMWVNPLHRQHLLGRSNEPKSEPESAGSIPQIIGRAILSGLVQQSDNGDLCLLPGKIYGTEMSKSIARDIIRLVM